VDINLKSKSVDATHFLLIYLNSVRLKLAALIVVMLANGEIKAQNYPIYNGYFLNPYIYNPAAAATERLQVNASYRRQWFGIPGAPSISSLTASTLLDGTRAGIGFKVSTFSRGILNSTDASVAYAYGVPLSKVNKLFFGLSGGMVSNTLNLSDVANPADAALTNASTGIVPNASFGVLFKNSNGLNLGFTLPKLFGVQSYNSKYSFSYSDNMIFTASFSRWQPSAPTAKRGKSRNYKSKKSSNVPLELFAIYRYSSFGGLYEATGKFNFNTSVWLSATYRQYAGIIPGLGINTDNVSLGYFYEPGVGGDMPLKTHEILLNIHLGKDKKYREKKPVPPPSKITTAPQKVVAKVPDKKIEPVTKPPVVPPKVEKKDSVVVHQPRFKKGADPLANVVSDTAGQYQRNLEERKALEKHIAEHAEGKHDDTHDQPVNQRHDFVKRGTHHEELEVATFVIAGAFQSRSNAEHYVSTLRSLGYKDADFGHLSVRNLWYVFIAEEAEIPDARKARNELQKNKIFRDVWLLTVQE
jgi:type IX secretion system PorP/SprF family membrane protein